MPSMSHVILPAPRSWDEFEDMALAAAKINWPPGHFTRNGRPGQKQHGVDIYEYGNSSRQIGIQCKNTIAGVTPDVITSEIEKSRYFHPPLSALYIATTAPRDARTQQFVREISAKKIDRGEHFVEILFWDDVSGWLARDRETLYHFYPDMLQRQKKNNDCDLVEEIKSILPWDEVRRLYNFDYTRHWSYSEFDSLYVFLERIDEPRFCFFNIELRHALLSLKSSVDAFFSAERKYAGYIPGTDLYGILRNQHDYEEGVAAMHDKVIDIDRSYRAFIQAGVSCCGN